MSQCCARKDKNNLELTDCFGPGHEAQYSQVLKAASTKRTRFPLRLPCQGRGSCERRLTENRRADEAPPAAPGCLSLVSSRCSWFQVESALALQQIEACSRNSFAAGMSTILVILPGSYTATRPKC